MWQLTRSKWFSLWGKPSPVLTDPGDVYAVPQSSNVGGNAIPPPVPPPSLREHRPYFGVNGMSEIATDISEDGTQILKYVVGPAEDGTYSEMGCRQMDNEREIYKVLEDRYITDKRAGLLNYYNQWPFPRVTFIPSDAAWACKPKLTIEKIAGNNLFVIIKRFPTSSLFTRLWWATEICRGLKILHSLTIAHRDLFPANIMISSSGSRAYLIDFGSSRLGGNPELLWGRSPYNLPGEQCDTVADFAFGHVLYFILHGGHPEEDRPRDRNDPKFRPAAKDYLDHNFPRIDMTIPMALRKVIQDCWYCSIWKVERLEVRLREAVEEVGNLCYLHRPPPWIKPSRVSQVAEQPGLPAQVPKDRDGKRPQEATDSKTSTVKEKLDKGKQVEGSAGARRASIAATTHFPVIDRPINHGFPAPEVSVQREGAPPDAVQPTGTTPRSSATVKPASVMARNGPAERAYVPPLAGPSKAVEDATLQKGFHLPSVQEAKRHRGVNRVFEGLLSYKDAPEAFNDASEVSTDCLVRELGDITSAPYSAPLSQLATDQILQGPAHSSSSSETILPSRGLRRKAAMVFKQSTTPGSPASGGPGT
ncbi:hypothetical protein P7C70_g6252, partial [Phenoliferia sp. Uapishka_3]